ncbi:MAG: efflux RND transporter permease subunit [Gammaproteobacteria bacterium]
MHISEVTVNRPVFAAVLSLFVILIGLASYDKLTIREYPDIDRPVVTVTTIYTGASSKILERDVTEIIEDSLSGISGIREITSESRDELSKIRVEFTLETNLDTAANDVRDKVSRIAALLPDDADNPRIAKSDSDARAIMWIGFSSDILTSIQLNDYLDRNIVDRLSIQPGVASITIGGERKYSIRIWMDPEQIASRQLTIVDVIRAIKNENIERGAGRFESNEREVGLKLDSKLKTLDEYSKIVIRHFGDSKILLSDVAKIEIGPESERGFLRANKKSAIGLGIVRQTKSNVLDVANNIKDELELIRPSLPESIDMSIGYDQSKFVNESINEIRFALTVSMILVILIVYYFLSSKAATIIPAVTIPISIIGTFFIIHVFGYSLNVLTFLALVLAIGLIVDDSIVVMENIKRRIENGEDNYTAAINGAKQITFVVIATTLVLVSVFLPLSFMGGKTGRLFIEFGVVLSFAVIISSFVALTLTPMMCSKLLKKDEDQSERKLFIKFKKFYEASLLASQNKPKIVYSVTIIFIIISVLLFQFLPKELAPSEDRGIFIVSVNAPEGSSLDYTDNMVKKVENVLEEYVNKGEIKTVFAIVAPGFSGQPGNVNSAFIFASLTPWEDRRHQREIVREIFPKLISMPGAMIFTINPPSLGQSPFKSPVRFVISGTNYDQVGEWGKSIKNISEDIGLRSARIDYKVDKPRINLKINRDAASNLGVSADDIATTLDALYASRKVTKFSKDGLTYNVVVKADDKYLVDVSNLDNIYIKSSLTKELIPLSNLVTNSVEATSKSLKRINRLPSVTLSSSIAPGSSLGVILDELSKASSDILPSNAKISYAGASKEYYETGYKLELTILLAILVVYLVLSAQFESFRNPLIIILTVPITMTAGIYSLFVTGGSLNVYSQIGFLMLIGLIAKNGILVVEFANQLKDEGVKISKAIIESSIIRFRPVIMTTISTLLGSIPLIISSGAGAESRFAMAVVVFGGIALASFITLYLIPALYLLIEKDN